MQKKKEGKRRRKRPTFPRARKYKAGTETCKYKALKRSTLLFEKEGKKAL